jgi:hypothetical protein
LITIKAARVDREIEEDWEEVFIVGLEDGLRDRIGVSRGGWLMNCRERLWGELEREGLMRL